MPFLPEFKAPVLQGRKTMTARLRPYGVPGDVLDTPFGRVILLGVWKERLGVIADRHFEREALASPRDFADLWTRIYPEAPFEVEREAFLHEFRRVRGSEGRQDYRPDAGGDKA